jgi:hypothetical protein
MAVFFRPHHTARKLSSYNRLNRFRLRLEELEPRNLLSVLTPMQIRHAYGFDQISFSNGAKGDGTGQTIAIVDAYDDPNIGADLAHFDSTFGLPDPPSFLKATPANIQADSGWAGEIALDVEWAHAVAPGAGLLLVEAASASYADLLSAVNFAATYPGVSVVSMSWGSGEFSAETGAAYDGVFANRPGVSFVASSGDYGAPPSWPAVSPNVLAVGGTRLSVDSAGNYLSEKGWGNGSSSRYSGGSGGGISRYEPKPSFQSSVTQSSTKRTSPDVAYNADPNSGVYVYDSFNGGWFSVGGTSAGAPQWSGLVAIANQGRAALGKGTLSATDTLPAIYGLPSADFHDVTSGNNGYSATTGYDLVTGRGSPRANLVVAGLVAVGAAPAAQVNTGTSGGTGTGGAHAVPRPVITTPVVVQAPTAPTQVLDRSFVKSFLSNVPAFTNPTLFVPASVPTAVVVPAVVITSPSNVGPPQTAGLRVDSVGGEDVPLTADAGSDSGARPMPRLDGGPGPAPAPAAPDQTPPMAPPDAATYFDDEGETVIPQDQGVAGPAVADEGVMPLHPLAAAAAVAFFLGASREESQSDDWKRFWQRPFAK